MLIECPKFQELRIKSLKFLTNGNKHELYTQLNLMSRAQIKALVNFMDVVENEIKEKQTNKETDIKLSKP